jgi:hypothetical protein
MSKLQHNLQRSNYIASLTIRDQSSTKDIVKAHFKFHRRVTEGNYLVNGQVIYISKFYDLFTGKEKQFFSGV